LSSSSFSVFLFLFLFVHHESRPSFLITLPPYAAGTLGRLLSRNRATSSGDGERLLEAASPYTERRRPRRAGVYCMGQKNPLSFMRISLVLEVRSCWPEFMVVSTFKVLQVSGQYKKYASVHCYFTKQVLKSYKNKMVGPVRYRTLQCQQQII